MVGGNLHLKAMLFEFMNGNSIAIKVICQKKKHPKTGQIFIVWVVSFNFAENEWEFIEFTG